MYVCAYPESVWFNLWFHNFFYIFGISSFSVNILVSLDLCVLFVFFYFFWLFCMLSEVFSLIECNQWKTVVILSAIMLCFQARIRVNDTIYHTLSDHNSVSKLLLLKFLTCVDADNSLILFSWRLKLFWWVFFCIFEITQIRLFCFWFFFLFVGNNTNTIFL